MAVARAQVREGRRGRRRRHLRARDPRQRDATSTRVIDSLLPRRRRGRARRQRAGARVGPRVAGGAEVPPQPRRSPEWFVPVHGEYRHMVHHAELASRVGVEPDERVRLRGRRRGHDRRPPRLDVERQRGAGRATSTSTASSATSARACCATAASSPRRAWSWCSSPSTSAPGEIVTGPEIVTKGWVYAPEAEALLEEAKAAVRARARGGRGRGRAPTSRPCGATPAARSASSSTSAPSAGRRSSRSSSRSERGDDPGLVQLHRRPHRDRHRQRRRRRAGDRDPDGARRRGRVGQRPLRGPGRGGLPRRSRPSSGLASVRSSPTSATATEVARMVARDRPRRHPREQRGHPARGLHDQVVRRHRTRPNGIR